LKHYSAKLPKEKWFMFPTKKVQSMVGSKIQVEMKGSPRYVLEGVLNSVDEYLNLHLLETVELIGGEKTRSLGSVILRGNNIILISPVE
jgi:U6 snRNA-associated Sm-like protein LSm5